MARRNPLHSAESLCCYASDFYLHCPTPPVQPITLEGPRGFFGKHASQLSEIFWEALERFLEMRQHLITGDMHRGFMEARVGFYATAIARKGNALQNCVGFIDGTVIGIARPGDSEIQRIAYNGHKENTP
jgi:hypothetical protein